MHAVNGEDGEVHKLFNHEKSSRSWIPDVLFYDRRKKNFFLRVVAMASHAWIINETLAHTRKEEWEEKQVAIILRSLEKRRLPAKSSSDFYYHLMSCSVSTSRKRSAATKVSRALLIKGEAQVSGIGWLSSTMRLIWPDILSFALSNSSPAKCRS